LGITARQEHKPKHQTVKKKKKNTFGKKGSVLQRNTIPKRTNQEKKVRAK